MALSMTLTFALGKASAIVLPLTAAEVRPVADVIHAFQRSTVLSGLTTINPAATASKIDCSLSDRGIGFYTCEAPPVRRIKASNSFFNASSEGRSINMAM